MEIIIFIILYVVGKYIYRLIISQSEVRCPYCSEKFDIAEGIWNCSNCKQPFRKIKDRVYKIEEVTYPLVDEMGTLFSQIAKADGIVSKKEKDYIVSVLVDNFDLNNSQREWILTICNKAKDESYNISTINAIKRETKTLKETKYIQLEILYICMVIINIDNGPSESQNKIIKDIIDTFEISLSDYEEIKSNLLGVEDDIYIKQDYIEECFRILDIPVGSSKEEIIKAYKELAKIYHPDKYISSELHESIKVDIEDKMKDINNAYEFLMNQN